MKVDFPQEVQLLISHLKRFPGIGPRSAERIAIWLLQSPSTFAEDAANAILAARENVRACGECGFFQTEASPCPICNDHTRESDLVCVVEHATDILPLERTGAFKGQYHALGGKISPLDNVSPEDLRIDPLLRRVREGAFKEVILAVGSDVEGEATANYLAEILSEAGVPTSRIAQGLPAGGGLEHADELTLFRALDGRRKL